MGSEIKGSSDESQETSKNYVPFAHTCSFLNKPTFSIQHIWAPHHQKVFFFIMTLVTYSAASSFPRVLLQLCVCNLLRFDNLQLKLLTFHENSWEFTVLPYSRWKDNPSMEGYSPGCFFSFDKDYELVNRKLFISGIRLTWE